MTYSIRYVSSAFPDGNSLTRQSSLEESSVPSELYYLWAYAGVRRVIVTDNDNGEVVYDSSDRSERFKPFGPIMSEPAKLKKSVIEIL